MNKRYQVFVSSTFADLQEERSRIIQTVMELDCIPAGMELFPAIDEEQFEFIKKVIDDCDYYLLVIGGRYGSVSDTGVSYTEMEYDYAISKGIKVIAFLHQNPEDISLGKSEQVAESKEKLSTFRAKVATGRLVKFWRNAEELPGLVALNLPKTIRTYPAIGWVRADAVMDPQVYKELNDLRKENQQLKDESINRAVLPSTKINNLAGLDESVTIKGGFTAWIPKTTPIKQTWEITLSWAKLFGSFAPYLLDESSDSSVRVYIAQILSNKAGAEMNAATPTIDSEDYQTIKIQFKALGLIEIERNGGPESIIKLTELGEEELMSIRTIRTNKLKE